MGYLYPLQRSRKAERGVRREVANLALVLANVALACFNIATENYVWLPVNLVGFVFAMFALEGDR